MGEPSLLCPDSIYKTLEKVHIIRNWLQVPIVGKSLMGIIGDGIWSFKKVIRYKMGC